MEELFRILDAVFSTRNDIVFVYDPLTNRSVYWNHSFSELTAYSDNEIQKLKIPGALFNPKHVSKLNEGLEQPNNSYGPTELSIVRKSKDEIPILFAATKLKFNESDHELIMCHGQEISFDKGKENKANITSEIFDLVINTIPHFVFWKDRNSVYLGCNNNFASISGIKDPKDVYGKTDYDLLWKRKEAELYRKIDKRIMETGVPELNRLDTRTNTSGETTWLRTNKLPITNHQDEIIGVIGIYENVTESKMINDSLEIIASKFAFLKEKEFFKNVCEYLSVNLGMDYVFIGELTPGENQIDTAAAVYKGKLIDSFSYLLKGSPCEKVIGEGPSIYKEGVTGLFPNDKNLKKLKIEGYIGTPLIDPEGVPLGIIVMMNEKKLEEAELKLNIQSLFVERVSSEIQRSKGENLIKENEQNYRKLVEQSNDAIYLLVDDKFVLINPAFNKMFGYTMDELSHPDFSLMQIVAPSSRKGISERSEMLKKGIEPKNIYEFTALDKKNNEIECQASISYIDYKGKKAAQGIVRDISERKRSEALLKKQNEDYQELSLRYSVRNRELKESIKRIQTINKELEVAKNKAEESDRLKSAFLANMSHEIRTPMNGILGFANILKDHTISDEKKYQYLEIIEASGHRMLNLINDLIDISKIEAGLMEVNPGRFNLNKLILSVYDFFQPMVNLKDLSLKTFMALADEKAELISDENKLHQILTNLINNAVKFTSEGEITFGYELNGTDIKFFVKDTGQGIEDELKDAIFERFRQGEISFSKEYEGAGLGLAISKALVHILGGKIWLETRLNSGSEFYFTLPIKYSDVKEKKPVYDRVDPEESSLEGLCLLIAEDDDVSYDLMVEMLSNVNIRFIRAANGQEALEAVKENDDIGIVLMDVKMPFMNGIDATREIKVLRPELPVIIQSAYVQENEQILAKDAGCDGYLTKPIDRKLLLNEILRSYHPKKL